MAAALAARIFLIVEFSQQRRSPSICEGYQFSSTDWATMRFEIRSTRADSWRRCQTPAGAMSSCSRCRGSVPVGSSGARPRLPLDVFLVRKIGRGHAELAISAIAEGGVRPQSLIIHDLPFRPPPSTGCRARRSSSTDAIGRACRALPP
jgi:hypothetical protein